MKMKTSIEKMAVDCGKVYITGVNSGLNIYMKFGIGTESWAIRTGRITYPTFNAATKEFQTITIESKAKISDIDKVGLDSSVDVPKKILRNGL